MLYTLSRYIPKKSFSGIIIPKTVSLTFANVKKELSKLVKKNKETFIKLVEKQMKKYKKIIKDK